MAAIVHFARRAILAFLCIARMIVTAFDALIRFFLAHRAAVSLDRNGPKN